MDSKRSLLSTASLLPSCWKWKVGSGKKGERSEAKGGTRNPQRLSKITEKQWREPEPLEKCITEGFEWTGWEHCTDTHTLLSHPLPQFFFLVSTLKNRHPSFSRSESSVANVIYFRYKRRAALSVRTRLLHPRELFSTLEKIIAYFFIRSFHIKFWFVTKVVKLISYQFY